MVTLGVVSLTIYEHLRSGFIPVWQEQLYSVFLLYFRLGLVAIRLISAYIFGILDDRQAVTNSDTMMVWSNGIPSKKLNVSAYSYRSFC